MKNTSIKNIGIPVFVDKEADLSTKETAATDSWYIKFNFRINGREIGLEWHQMTFKLSKTEQISMVDFLLMDATQNIWLEHTDAGIANEKNGPRPSLCSVISKFGTFEGDIDGFTLQLNAEDASVNVVMKPTDQVLYNGSVGLIPLLGSNSNQFAFPNMEITGTVRLKDEIFEVKNTTAWFDRQWTNFSSGNGAALPSWLWLGMSLNPEKTAVISLWDTINGKTGERYSFATILDSNGVQSNHVANIIYDKIWTSNRTGNSYPSFVTIKIPTAKLELTLNAMLEEPEFVKGMGKMKMGGSQCPCTIKGHYGTTPINQVEIVEMIGDLCGEGQFALKREYTGA